MKTNRDIKLSFKVTWQKKWTLLYDRIIYADREILFNKIQAVKVVAKSSFLTNGVIQITVNGKVINLVYPNNLKEDGERAIVYLQNNYGTKEDWSKREGIRRIQAEIDSLPCKDDWGTRKEIAELPSIIGKDEHIKAMTSGFLNGDTWLLLCTNKRVLMIDKGMFYGLNMVDIPLDRINSISHSKGSVAGTISITDGATTRTIEEIYNETISFFVNTVNKEIELYKQAKITPITQVVNTTSTADELIKYKQLLDMGVLTQEEFTAKKKELLGL